MKKNTKNLRAAMNLAGWCREDLAEGALRTEKSSRDVAQSVECLPNTQKALGMNFSAR